MKEIEFVYDDKAGRYVPLSDGDHVRELAHSVVSGGSTADVCVYDDKGDLVAKVMRPPSVYPLYLFDPFHGWKRDVVEWLTSVRPNRWEPLRFRRWTRKSDGSWKKSFGCF